jgi:hypothetical protein
MLNMGGTEFFLGLNPKGFRAQPQILQKYAAESWSALDPGLGKVTKCPESSKPRASPPPLGGRARKAYVTEHGLVVVGTLYSLFS